VLVDHDRLNPRVDPEVAIRLPTAGDILRYCGTAWIAVGAPEDEGDEDGEAA
jgi:hypothetical protein